MKHYHITKTCQKCGNSFSVGYDLPDEVDHVVGDVDLVCHCTNIRAVVRDELQRALFSQTAYNGPITSANYDIFTG